LETPGGRRHSRPQLGVHIPTADTYSYPADEAEVSRRYSTGTYPMPHSHSTPLSALPYPLSTGNLGPVMTDAPDHGRDHYPGLDHRLLRRSSMPVMPSDMHHHYPQARILPQQPLPPQAEYASHEPEHSLDSALRRPTESRPFSSQMTQTTYLTPISPVMNRLAPDSTLLTPLPGYVPDRPLHSPLSGGLPGETPPGATPDYTSRSWGTPPDSISNYR
jgi:hypothetical protein